MSAHTEHGHVGVQELLPLLGVSRARVYQLINDDPTFPQPVAELRAGKVWHTADVEAWAAHRRPSGRPVVAAAEPLTLLQRMRFPGE